MRRHCLGVHGWYDNTRVRHTGCKPAIAPDNATYACAHRPGKLQRTDQVEAHASLGIPTTYGKDEDGISGAETAPLEPIGERSIPAIVVDAGSELRNVVRWRVGLESGNLAKVINRVGSVPRAA